MVGINFRMPVIFRPRKAAQKVALIAILAAWIVCFSTRQALAIPSPELVIGSVSSLSQVFAVAFATLTGAGTFAAKRLGISTGRHQSKWLAKVTLGLFLICVLLGSLNVYQIRTHRAAEQERLQATLLRPAQFDGTEIKDASLIETGFDSQLTSPLAITTEEAATLIGENDSVRFVDVREAGEHQMGTLPGAVHVRYPDFFQSEHASVNTPVVLFCHNGNRSSETCAKLAAQGVDCRFIAGGIEKWLVEGRSLSDRSIENLSDLRSLPEFPNKETLLSTTDFQQALDSADLQIVDTRYPGDFAASHLPGAINIPIRALPSSELADRIASLANKPTVAACYDRRSCFMSQVLGLELSKSGIPFIGRYTTPWEYFVPPPTKPHVSAWLEEQQQTRWQGAVAALSIALLAVAEQTHLLVALFALSVISRLMVLPITLKSERDQIVSSAHRDRLSELKAQLAHDPIRKARAIKHFHNGLGLTPGRNLIGLLFLPLMMLGLSAAEMSAAGSNDAFLRRPLSLPDQSFVAPAVFSLLACAYLQWVAARSRKQAVLWWMLGFPLILFLVFRLSLAGNIYLCFSLSLLLLQRAFVIGAFGKIYKSLRADIQRKRGQLPVKGVYRLNNVDALKHAGNKSLRLAQMKLAGFNVPDGVVITQPAIEKYLAMKDVQKQAFADLIWHSVGQVPCAVRSSASAEDGADTSFAGVFDSVLDVDGPRMKTSLNAVIRSFSANRVAHYKPGDDPNDGNILIQQMVDADYAGVVFTRDPSAPGLAMIELVRGAGDDLVSGRVTPETYRVGRFSKLMANDASAPIDLTPLVEMSRQIEQLFGAPQDIEWAFAQGQFFILQSRDITATLSTEAGEMDRVAEWDRLLKRFAASDPDDVILEMDEMSEVLPEPTPISFSLMSRLWGAGGSLDLACRRLALGYDLPEGLPGHLVLVFGKTFVDQALKQSTALKLTAAKSKRLKKSAPQVFEDYRTKTIPRLQTAALRWDAMDFDLLPAQQVVDCIREIERTFVSDAYVEAEVINIYADFLTSEANRHAETEPSAKARLLSPTLPNAPTQLVAACAGQHTDDRRAVLLAAMGHRASFDYELSAKRYAEDMAPLEALADCATPTQPEQVRINPDDIVSLAIAFQDLKEQAKHEALRFIAILRRALLALDNQVGLSGLIFHASLDELDQATLADTSTFAAMLKARQEKRDYLLEKAPKVTSLTLHEMEKLTADDARSTARNGELGGTCVSGQSHTVGSVFRADKVADPKDAFANFKDGDIIVCQMLNPDWLPYVQRSGGILTEVGGWLSHMAIVAREKGIMMLVNCSGLDTLENGQLIVVSQSGAIERESSG